MSDQLVVGASVGRVYGRGPGAVTALRNASFSVERGQKIAIVGPSGSGKSTVLHLIAALVEPTSGDLSWPALGAGDRLVPRHACMSFQGPSLLPPLTVLENVEFPMLLAETPKSEASERAGSLLQRFGLEDVADRLPEELSGGQSQRAAIARALAPEPELILADEPTGQLDGRSAQEAMDAILESCERTGAALVLATHDPAVAERLDVLWTIDAGSLDAGTGAA